MWTDARSAPEMLRLGEPPSARFLHSALAASNCWPGFFEETG